MGGGLRADNASVALWRSPDRQRLEPLVEADVVERNLFLWAREEIALTPRLQLVLGQRGTSIRDTSRKGPCPGPWGPRPVCGPACSTG